MVKTLQISHKLTEQIAILFYVIANSDGRITDDERMKLRSVIDERWSAYDKETTGLIIRQFEEASRANLAVDGSFNKFMLYAHQHPEVFTTTLVQLILKTCSSIAYSYAKLNKAELHYLARLNLEFKKMGF